MASASHSQVPLRATEGIVESTGGLLGRLGVERAAYHERRRPDTAGKVRRPSSGAERGRPSNAGRSPAAPERVLGNRRFPQGLAYRRVNLLRTILGIDLLVPGGEEITLVR